MQSVVECYLLDSSTWLSYPAFLQNLGTSTQSWHHPNCGRNSPSITNLEMMYHRLINSLILWRHSFQLRLPSFKRHQVNLNLARTDAYKKFQKIGSYPFRDDLLTYQMTMLTIACCHKVLKHMVFCRYQGLVFVAVVVIFLVIGLSRIDGFRKYLQLSSEE